jgi:RNA polymerase sigma factor (TIGR02999 family)
VDQAAPEITRLLRAWGAGDAAALERLTPLVYSELHGLARRYMRREKPGSSLQTTALVNEAYLKLVDLTEVSWQDRAHFFAISANLMRRILVDAARAKGAGKRGGQAVRMELNESIDASPLRPEQLIRLDDALQDLAQLDPRKAKVVELRFFGGLTAEETAEVLKVSAKSVLRDWSFSRAWLMLELK